MAESATGTGRHQLVTGALYYAAACLTLFVVATGIVVPSAMLPGIWAWIGGFFGFAVTGSLAAAGWRWLRRRRTDGFYRLHFPAYGGEQFYAGSLLGAEDPEGRARVPGDHHKVADGGDVLFVLGGGKTDAPHERIGGKMVRHASGAPLAVRKADVLAVRVHELNDAAILAATKSTDDQWADRAVEQGVAMLMGRKVTHTVIPYGAYVELLHRHRDGLGRLLWAVRTDVPAGAMRALGAEDQSDTEAMVRAAAAMATDKIGDEIKDTAHDFAREHVGAALGQPVLDAADGLATVHHDLVALASLGSAKIGPTNGTRARLYARLVAERLRAVSELDTVEVIRIAD